VKFTLEDYQRKAVDQVLLNLAKAQRDYELDAEHTAVALTAPTGAGKTVIATGVLEALYLGTERWEAQPDLTVLWLTDDRSLNAQTIGKILQASGGRLDANRIRFLADTDERTLEPGYLYFVHIQALQRNSTLHAVRPDGTRSDRRTFGAWEMISNTARDRGGEFLVVWDEAHRGAGSSDTERRTIARTIVDGGTTNVGTHQVAAPIVLGISATPERFNAAMASAERVMRPVDVPAADVRRSGLLKDRILLRTIDETQQADNTMLALAVADLKTADSAWRAHHETTGDRLVEPLLVVQVEQAVTQARLAEILTTVESAWPELSDMAVAHAFGDPHGPLHVGDRTVRYLPPEAISGDDRARVVLFKSALTTGWDCPRAEVLVSFQGKESYTEIAQLIGRLVRTPLARRVESGDDRLNEVVAYLPQFNTQHVVDVVTALTEDETVEVEVLIAPVLCERSRDVPAELFTLLDTLPSYTRPRASFPNRTAQLMRLAASLNEHGLVNGASGKARAWIVNQVRAADAAREDEVDAKVKDLMTLSVGTVVVGLDADIITSPATVIDAPTAERDLDGYYTRALRLLPDGSAAWYYNELCDRGMDEVDAGARVAALAALGFVEVIETQAAELIKTWRDAHRSAVTRLPRPVRDLIEPLWHLEGAAMQPTTVEARQAYPAATLKAGQDDTVEVPTYPHHLYVIPKRHKNSGRFPVDTTRSTWEAEVLARELDSDTLVGWYRNPSSGRHALAVPYEFGDKTQLMHPDFLFFHRDGDELVLDIVDPHRHDLADTAPKWAALATYANDHPDQLRRVLAVIRDGSGALRALDLTTAGVGPRIAQATNRELLEGLFSSAGMHY
jgi:type III restriction enzyme